MAERPEDTVAHLVVNGSEYYEWKALRVQRDWKTIPSVFSFVCAEPGTAGRGYSGLRLKPGDVAAVYLGGVAAATCYITDRTTAYDAESHDVVVSGKSITCDVVDSSIPIKPGTYNGQTIEQATRSVIAPHGVGLVVQNPPAIFSKPFKSLVPHPGETCFEFIQRMCAMRTADVCDDAQGNLIIGQGRTGSIVADLQEGRNIKSARGTLSDQTAWSRYSIFGQNVAYDDAQWPPRNFSASLTDGNARSNRIRIAPSQHPGDSDEMKAAVTLDRMRSDWPQVQVQVVVRGWKRDDGQLWDVTDNISISSPMLFPTESGAMVLGIQSVLFAQDDRGGTTTTLTLVKTTALSERGSANTPAIPGAGQPASGPLDTSADPAQIDTPDTGSA